MTGECTNLLLKFLHASVSSSFHLLSVLSVCVMFVLAEALPICFEGVVTSFFLFSISVVTSFTPSHVTRCILHTLLTFFFFLLTLFNPIHRKLTPNKYRSNCLYIILPHHFTTSHLSDVLSFNSIH